MKKIIFACVHSAGRSQMCAALFNKHADKARYLGVAAGTQPATRVHPEVVEVMKELGIDLSDAKPQQLTEELAKDATLLITLGCGENCPYVPGLEVQDWPLNDPKGKDLDSVRVIRDEIALRIQDLIKAKFS